MRLVLATRNDHKVRELSRLMPGAELEPLPAGRHAPARGRRHVRRQRPRQGPCRRAALGGPAIGDDSGVESDALGGAPGIYSARFAGPDASDGDNLAKLRAEAPAGSGLRYVCVMAYAEPGGTEATFTGTCEGTLAAEARGDGGFGYDPAFLPADVADGRTMAELWTRRRTRSRTAAGPPARSPRGWRSARPAHEHDRSSRRRIAPARATASAPRSSASSRPAS